MADKFLSWLAVVVACVILLAHAGITISESSGWVLEDLEDVWRAPCPKHQQYSKAVSLCSLRCLTHFILFLTSSQVLTTDFHADPLAEMTLRILFYEGCTSSPTSYGGLRWQLGRLSSRTLVVLDKYTCASLARLAWVLMLRSDPMRWQPSWTDSGLYDRSMTIKIPLGLSSTERVGPNEIGYC